MGYIATKWFWCAILLSFTGICSNGKCIIKVRIGTFFTSLFIYHHDNNSIWLIVVWGGVHYTLQYVHVSYYERLLIGMLSKTSLVVIFLWMLIVQIIYHCIHLIRNELLGMLYYLTSSLESEIIQIKRWYSKILEIDCTM